jgi:hypothetical protein
MIDESNQKLNQAFAGLVVRKDRYRAFRRKL